MVASATLLYTARSSHSWGGSWSQQPATRLGPVFRSQGTPGFTSLREEGARQLRQRQAGVWRGRQQALNTSLETGGAEIRVEQRGGETVIEFARSGEAQGWWKINIFLCLFTFQR